MQLTIYLIILWVIVTLTFNYRRNAILALVWLMLTAVMLWPVVRRAVPAVESIYRSQTVQAPLSQLKAELDAELRAEFPEFYHGK